MKRALLVSFVLLLTAHQARAAEETVSYKSGDETVSAFLAKPDGKGPFPGVIVIQEWWGLDNWIKDQARALAKEGNVALAVDLYRGKVTNKPEEAHQLMMGTPRDRAMRDLKAAYAYLQGRAEVRKNKIGAIGWCMGGSTPWRSPWKSRRWRRPSRTTARRRRILQRSPRSRRLFWATSAVTTRGRRPSRSRRSRRR